MVRFAAAVSKLELGIVFVFREFGRGEGTKWQAQGKKRNAIWQSKICKQETWGPACASASPSLWQAKAKKQKS